LHGWDQLHDSLVDPEVRKDVDDEDLGERSLVTPVTKDGKGECDTDVGDDDVPVVSGFEDDRLGREVWCQVRLRNSMQ
jgi:hypothetical protein